MDVKYEFGPRFSVRAGAAWALSPIDEQQIFTGLIMCNYKYLTQGRTDLEQLPGYSVDGELDLNCEYYFNKYGADQSLHNYFLDVSAWYFVNSRLQFFIHARNLLDEREYAYSYIGPLETTHYSYRIGPLNILVGAQIKF